MVRIQVRASLVFSVNVELRATFRKPRCCRSASATAVWDFPMPSRSASRVPNTISPLLMPLCRFHTSMRIFIDVPLIVSQAGHLSM
ncbi:hypothetical protein TSO221_11340 [Azospirillum sp. TSO22-1]|nr:hypothetical protein TSO221_11340 [Azospirillum sp. TSO22-1]